MHTFVYCNPTKIVFGNGEIKKTGTELASLGLKKVLLVYGRSSIKTNGVYATITAALNAEGIDWVEHAGISSNPLLSQVHAGIALAKAKQVDGILAVGGGSVIDASKAIALGSCTTRDVWDFYMGAATPENALPLVAVLTLPATGTEMNGGTVVTHDETREKRAVVHASLNPKTSILDPETTLSVPADYVAYSASDAISHTIESYLTRQPGFLPVQDGYDIGVVKAIMRATERILANPQDIEARSAMMWAATLAWNFLGSSGVGPWQTPAHTLEHPMSGLFNVPHGAGLAVTGPAWMTWESQRRIDRVAAFGREIMDVAGADDVAVAAEGIARFKAWLKKIGNPITLAECNIPESAIPELAKHAEILAKAWGTGAEYTASTCAEIFRLAR
jgi:alcohol dehydrogenase YqhD (iron-dependent ADH family)